MPHRVRDTDCYFPLLVNFFTATRNSSVCMQSMMASFSASSCCSTGVTGARWISALVAAIAAGAFWARRSASARVAAFSFSAQQAYDWGLVAKVVPAAELKAATRALAERLAQNAPAAIAATKTLIHRAHTTPVEQQLEAEKDGIIDCMHSDEFRVAVKKFTSKTK